MSVDEWKTMRELGHAYERKKVSPLEVVEEFLRRIKSENGRLNAYLTVTVEEARRAARESKKRWEKKRTRGPLDGIPISIKDNIYTKGIRTTAGSKILHDFVPATDAHVVACLRAAGAIILGKTNLHEFAYGVTTENPHYGSTRNPWNLERSAGGSSGGSGAALAAALCAGSVGTDTGGSVRIPAALCGVVGLKPSYGAMSLEGVVPLSPSLDHVGPMGRCVEDVRIIFRALEKKPLKTNRAKGRKPLSGIRIGWPREYFFERVAGEVMAAVEQAVRALELLGGKRREVSVARVNDVEEASTAIAFAEATRVHMAAGWWPARAEEYGHDVRDRLERGGKITALEYWKALDMKKEICADFTKVFEHVDVLVAPTTPVAAPKLGEKVVKIDGVEETIRAALIRLNRPANLTGQPSISVPCGKTSEGLPVGLQLMAGYHQEELLLRVAEALEAVISGK